MRAGRLHELERQRLHLSGRQGQQVAVGNADDGRAVREVVGLLELRRVVERDDEQWRNAATASAISARLAADWPVPWPLQRLVP